MTDHATGHGKASRNSTNQKNTWANSANFQEEFCPCYFLANNLGDVQSHSIKLDKHNMAILISPVVIKLKPKYDHFVWNMIGCGKATDFRKSFVDRRDQNDHNMKTVKHAFLLYFCSVYVNNREGSKKWSSVRFFFISFLSSCLFQLQSSLSV